MPYIITTYPIVEPGVADEEAATSVAVATLGEAKVAIEAHALVDGFAQFDVYQHGQLTESGGTIGALPDGTVIDVRQTTWPFLMLDAGMDEAYHGADWQHAAIIEAFNN